MEGKERKVGKSLFLPIIRIEAFMEQLRRVGDHD
jgi:hypothetical protein